MCIHYIHEHERKQRLMEIDISQRSNYNFNTAFVRQMTQLVNSVCYLKLRKAPPPTDYTSSTTSNPFYCFFLLTNNYDSKSKLWSHQCNVLLAKHTRIKRRKVSAPCGLWTYDSSHDRCVSSNNTGERKPTSKLYLSVSIFPVMMGKNMPTLGKLCQSKLKAGW